MTLIRLEFRIIMKRKKILIGFLLLCLAAGCLYSADAAQTRKQIRVGVYSRPPLQQVLGDGPPEGFALDLLETIAGEEDWLVSYTSCDLHSCLTQLENGNLDLVSAVPQTELENRAVELTRESIVQNWGQVYTSPGSGIEGVSDLQAQSIALVRGDPLTKAFWELLSEEGIQGNQILVDNYDRVMSSIITGTTPAGVVDHIYALEHADNYQVTATPIIFDPVDIGYAVPDGDPAHLAQILDQRLQSLKNDTDSEYYHARDRWFEKQPTNRVPDWLLWTLAGTGSAAAVLLAITWILRTIIRNRTRSLRKSEEKYRRFFQTSKDSVFITTKDGQWLDVNQATLALFGYRDRDLFLSTSVRDHYKHPEDHLEHLQQVEAQGFVKEYPVDMVRKDGTTIHTLITTAALRNDQGVVTGFQGTIRDITDQLEIQRELKVSSERLDLAVKGTNVGLWDWDIPSGEIVIDERWAEITGYTKEELNPMTIQTWERLAHPQDLEKSFQLISEHFAGDLDQYSCEVRIKHKEGHWVWVLDRGRVVEWAQDGKPLRMAGTHLDITERIEAENEIRDYIQKLENMQRITNALSSTLALDEVLELIMESITATIPYASATIFLVEDTGLKAFISRGLSEDIIGQKFPIDTPLFQEVKETRSPVIIDDASQDPRFSGWGGTKNIRGWMGVPLLIKGELIGYITFDSYQVHAYGHAEAELAEPFAAQAAQAIENARLYEEVQIYARELEQRVQDRTAELQDIVNLMAGREVRMTELKNTIQTLATQLEEHGIEPVTRDPLFDGLPETHNQADE